VEGVGGDVVFDAMSGLGGEVGSYLLRVIGKRSGFALPCRDKLLSEQRRGMD
jgi:hypothetical protein